jgi:hypothetical protein
MEEKIKYLELVEGSFTQEHLDKQTSQNPYTAYSIEEGKVIYNIKQESPYKMVDLGLSVKWADRNVGASSPEDAGLYFQWGDTVGYTADQVGVDKVFNRDSYFDTTDGGSTFNKYNYGGLTVLESSDDAVTVYMGSSYRMPTVDEVEELVENTTHIYIDLDGNEYDKQYLYDNIDAIESGKLKGIRFTSSNGNSIFIPACGNCNDSKLSEIGASGYVWTSSLGGNLGSMARSLSFSYFVLMGASGAHSNRYYGKPVRGVHT